MHRGVLNASLTIIVLTLLTLSGLSPGGQFCRNSLRLLCFPERPERSSERLREVPAGRVFQCLQTCRHARNGRVFAAGFVMTIFMAVAFCGGLHAQTLTPDMMTPTQGGFAPLSQSPLRRTADAANSGDATGTLRDSIAPSRINATPSYVAPAASGASDTGFDSLNRTRKKPKP